MLKKLVSFALNQPLFMILLFFAGFAAGFMNIYRAQTGQKFTIGEADKGKKEE